MQTEVAKRRRTARLLTGLAYEGRLHECLQVVCKTCPYCFVHTDPYTPANHSLSSCATIATPEFYAWRKGIRYASPGTACYHCHIPPGQNKTLHPTFTKDPTQCEFRDVVAPLVYALLKHVASKASLRSQFPGLDTATPTTALRWINNPETIGGHLTNLTALFMWFCDQYV